MVSPDPRIVTSDFTGNRVVRISVSLEKLFVESSAAPIIQHVDDQDSA